jgi:hypothetical protein
MYIILTLVKTSKFDLKWADQDQKYFVCLFVTNPNHKHYILTLTIEVKVT